ncbi:hypothetical protein AHAS_Ahas18G0247600 [Arachis hypogaea]
MNLQHTCVQTHKVGILHTKWLGAQFKKKVESNPRIKIKELQAKAHKKWNVTMTKSMVAKSKQEALSQIQGAFRKQYKRINDYCAELLRTNPDSSVSLKVIRSPDFAPEVQNPELMNNCVFQRLYVCFDACKKSFQHCRPFIMPTIKKKLEKKAKYARDWRPFWSAASKYEVMCGLDKFVVDLSAGKCSCRRWQMSGLPCPHAISSITFKGLDLELFVDDHYKKNAYLRSKYDDIMPPPYRRPSHRPVKKRKRGPGDEDNRSQTHLSRRGQTQKCSNYGALGHKKSGCTKPKKKVQYATQQAGKGPKRGIKVASSQPLGQTVQRGKLSRTSCSQPNSATTQPNPATTQPKKPSNPKAPLSQPLPKKSSAAASSTSNKESDSQPTDRKRHFSVIQTGAPHIPLQKLKLMAKLPPSAWDNL